MVYVFAQADELDAEMIQFVEYFQEMPDVSRDAIKRCHDHSIKSVSLSIRQKPIKT